jgi:hypothetical protein
MRYDYESIRLKVKRTFEARRRKDEIEVNCETIFTNTGTKVMSIIVQLLSLAQTPIPMVSTYNILIYYNKIKLHTHARTDTILCSSSSRAAIEHVLANGVVCMSSLTCL